MTAQEYKTASEWGCETDYKNLSEKEKTASGLIPIIMKTIPRAVNSVRMGINKLPGGRRFKINFDKPILKSEFESQYPFRHGFSQNQLGQTFGRNTSGLPGAQVPDMNYRYQLVQQLDPMPEYKTLENTNQWLLRNGFNAVPRPSGRNEYFGGGHHYGDTNNIPIRRGSTKIPNSTMEMVKGLSLDDAARYTTGAAKTVDTHTKVPLTLDTFINVKPGQQVPVIYRDGYAPADAALETKNIIGIDNPILRSILAQRREMEALHPSQFERFGEISIPHKNIPKQNFVQIGEDYYPASLTSGWQQWAAGAGLAGAGTSAAVWGSRDR